MNLQSSSIICNNCVGAGIYTLLKRQFDNPFMWCWMEYEDYFSLVKEFETIDFNKYVLSKNEKEYYLTVDDKININYLHYKKNNKYNKPQKIGMDVFYCDIESYIVEKYITRLKRMNNGKDKIFIAVESKEIDTYEKQKELQELFIKNNLKSIIITSFFNLKRLNRKENIVIYNPTIRNLDIYTTAKIILNKVTKNK